MKLPNAEEARVDESKVDDYLLCPDHPEGAGKAEFFRSFGFTAANWEVLAHALVVHAGDYPVSSAFKSRYGMKYCIDARIDCPDGRAPSIRAVWNIDQGGDYPRLVTVHPL